MNRNEAKEILSERRFIEDYLHSKGINTRKNFACLSGTHKDSNPSMALIPNGNRIHCFSCNATYDLFDLIGMDYGLNEFKDQLDKAIEIFNINGVEAYQNPNRSEQKTVAIHDSNKRNAESFSKDYENWNRNIKECTYLQERGISTEIANKLQLGYCTAFSTKDGVTGKFTKWNALIIPTSDNSYVARNTDKGADKKNRYRYRGTKTPFNLQAVKTSSEPIFITEGQLDAISIIETGRQAIALGGTDNKILFKAIEENRPKKPLILALDNDEVGEKSSKEIAEELTSLQIPYIESDNLYGEYKDANEAHTMNQEAFLRAIEATVQEAEEELTRAEREAKEAYLKTSTTYAIQDFLNGIASSVNTPYIPTGLTNLDNILDGGLFEGLYIVGAVSSLGKTTLVTQIADQIAQAGTDVLIFSLEMARTEIMSKSISRLTLLDVIQNGGSTSNAKTSRGITTGSRYANYSKEERELIERAVKAYGEFANRIYIHEGIGNIGAKQIRDTVEAHIRITGNRPVVVIDYLQILAPYDIRATDKQNTDKAVLELKRISRDYKLPIIGISSLNRQNYNAEINMTAFKESGAIEYSSDVLIGLQFKGTGGKDFNLNEAKQKDPREIELKILKNRNGATGKTIEYEYYPLFNYFTEA